MGKFLVHYEVLRNYMYLFLYSGHKDRVFLVNVKARNLLKNFATAKSINHHEFAEMKELIKEHQPSLVQLLDHLEEIGCTTSCPEELRGLLLSLSCNSAVCATFHRQDLGLLQELMKEKLGPDKKFQLQMNIPTLFELLSPLDDIPRYLIPVLKEIISIVERTFSQPICDIELMENHDHTHNLSFFPNLPKVRERGVYAMDKAKGDILCTKKFSHHSSLLPGIFTVFCPHGICYGFEVMECAESPNRPFSLLKTRFEEPPDVIIYDNSCNLHNYALNRDPAYFSNTLFVVDALHWDNHTACSQGYRAHSYPLLKNLNTQIVEQNNSKLRKLKSSLSYMKPENFMNTLKFFLWFCNYGVKSKRKG
ncbi:uncharacterized protein LOC134242143 [Saccostrea cucullata]|uniref:uncharacterized protein LOC134242143 n=1 Tax=Saccostrea cuccullata TaxID=36930 RepID=UPI002ECFF2A2